MDGLHFFIAASEIDREMNREIHGGPRGEYDPAEERGHLHRLRRLFRRDAMPVAGETAAPASVPSDRGIPATLRS